MKRRARTCAKAVSGGVRLSQQYEAVRDLGPDGLAGVSAGSRAGSPSRRLETYAACHERAIQSRTDSQGTW